MWYDADCIHPGKLMNPPLGTVGDKLWVKETWRRACAHRDDDTVCIAYAAQQEVGRGGLLVANIPSPHGVELWANEDTRWRPSIHMPRWASRIDLEITAVRVERLQDITEHDASREGVQLSKPEEQTYYGQFHRIWQSIYGTRPSLPKNERSKRYERVKRWFDKHPAMDWDTNPYVWVYKFRRIKP